MASILSVLGILAAADQLAGRKLEPDGAAEATGRIASSILTGSGGPYATPIPLATQAATFDTATEWQAKSRAALYLAIGAQPNQAYYEHLESGAREAIDSGIPAAYEPNGTPGALAQWCAGHAIAEVECALLSMAEYPGKVRMLAQIGDSRSQTVFRDCLGLNNYTIVAQCSLGLALVGDLADAAAIHVKALGYPAGHAARDELAVALYAFDDPSADALADEIVSSTAVAERLRETALEMKYRLAAVRDFYGQ